MAETVTVTVLNRRVKNILKTNPSINDIWVTGEISNLKKSTSGHYYLVLKDESAQITCVLFAGSRSRMPFEPKDNMKVNAFGHVDLYESRGSFQFIIENMRQSGIGDLYQMFEELKNKLQKEGLFDNAHKRILPPYPRNIGVVTSSTGAVIHDIITTSSTRFPANILLAPAQVQGADAAKTIVAGIELLNKQDVDVIIVGRGGGSIEDLWPFNEESVARAIFASKVPIVSAVGHETDFTIADFVADMRAPTPTGAAALILGDKNDIRDRIDNLYTRARTAIKRKLENCDSNLKIASGVIDKDGTSTYINYKIMDLDNLFSGAIDAVEGRISDIKHRLDVLYAKSSIDRLAVSVDSKKSIAESLYSNSCKAVANALNEKKIRLRGISDHIDALNPLNVLDRGYSMVRDSEGRVITSVDSIVLNQDISITFNDGSVTASVKEKVKK